MCVVLFSIGLPKVYFRRISVDVSIAKDCYNPTTDLGDD